MWRWLIVGTITIVFAGTLATRYAAWETTLNAAVRRVQERVADDLRLRQAAARNASPEQRAEAPALVDVLNRVAASLTEEQWRTLRRRQLLTFSTEPEPDTLLLEPSLALALRAARPSFPLAGEGDPPPGMELEMREAEAAWDRAAAIRVEVRLTLQEDADEVSAALDVVPFAVLPDGSLIEVEERYSVPPAFPFWPW